jgi:cell division septation protein DedD
MPGHHQRRRSIVRLVLSVACAAALASVLIGGSASLPGATASALSRWTGGVDLYRSGVFTTQKTWLWCTAADVQIIRNIARHTTDHTRANQSRYFSYMRAHDRYAIPVSDGTDPGGWAAGLRHYVDSRYHVVASSSFSKAVRSAVTNLRKTNLPVAVAVDHGNHGWVLTGFTATADPAKTTSFTVTSVRVVGPLYGLQSRSYGYDMRPDRRLTPSQFKSFFTPWHYGRIRMAWEGDWVSIQPIAAPSSSSTKTSATTSKSTAPTQAKATAQVTSMPTASPTPTPTASPIATATAAPVAIAPGAVNDGRPPAVVGLGAAALLVLAALLVGGSARPARSSIRRSRRA